jgi:hypothetical protein
MSEVETVDPAVADTSIETKADPVVETGGDKTLLSDDVAAAAVVSPRADWPDDWHTKLAGEDEKSKKMLERLGGVPALYKSWTEQRKLISEGGHKREQPLAADATPEQVAEWRKTHDVPETPADYLKGLPAATVIDADDEETANKFVERMHGANAPKSLVQQAVAAYFDVMAEERAAKAAQYEKDLKEATLELAGEWGQAGFKRSMNAIHGFLDLAPEGVKDDIVHGRGLDGVPLFSKPAVVRYFRDLAMQMNPVATEVPGGAVSAAASVTQRLAELQAMSGDNNSEYWSGPKAKALQAEMREMIEAQQKLEARGR